MKFNVTIRLLSGHAFGWFKITRHVHNIGSWERIKNCFNIDSAQLTELRVPGKTFSLESEKNRYLSITKAS